MKLNFDQKELREIATDLTKAIRLGKPVRKIYGDTTGPGFWLVGDHGIYMMTNVELPEGKKPKVVYARECNPETVDFDEWWDVKRQTFGGDDGCEFVPRETIVSMLAYALRYKVDSVSLELSEDGMRWSIAA